MPPATNTLPLINDYDLTPAEVIFYKEQGFLPLPNLVRKEKIEALRDEVKQVLGAHGLDEARLRKASEGKDKLRQFTQYLAGSLLEELINGERTRAVAGRLIGGEAIVYMPFTAVKAGGGGGTFDYHQDNNYTPHDPAMGVTQYLGRVGRHEPRQRVPPGRARFAPQRGDRFVGCRRRDPRRQGRPR